MNITRQMLNGLTAILLFCASSVLAEEKTWTVGERTLPLPAGASPQLQAALGNLPQPNPADFLRYPKSAEEWNAIIEPHNASRDALVKQAAPQLGVTIKEDRIGDAVIRHVTPAKLSPEFEDDIFLHTHSGGYVLNAGLAGTPEAVLIASRVGIKVIAIDYRMPPAHPFPAAVDDVVTVYQHYLKQYKPKNIVLGGSSAGGGLALAAIHKLKELKIPLPAALFAGSPWADLTKTSDSLYTLEGIDRGIVTYDGTLESS
ncbi:MAG: alpha/beta hydrolase fold domain-containing protein, partial [Pseudomonadota bacterium]